VITLNAKRGEVVSPSKTLRIIYIMALPAEPGFDIWAQNARRQGEKGSTSFSAEKGLAVGKQKHFHLSGSWVFERPSHDLKYQKFFGSFFQKRTAWRGKQWHRREC
jgi:hypothetical protein